MTSNERPSAIGGSALSFIVSDVPTVKFTAPVSEDGDLRSFLIEDPDGYGLLFGRPK